MSDGEWWFLALTAWGWIFVLGLILIWRKDDHD